MTRTDHTGTSPTADVVTEPVVFPSRSGLKIAGCWDHRHEDFEGCPFVVMAPKYGETKKCNLQLAYMLAANGMNVLRFDHTCHIGESAGDPGLFTLGKGLGDILGAYDFLESHFGCRAAALIASSLSVRPAIRAAATDPRVNQLVSLVGVVNLQATLRVVYGEDIVTGYQEGKRWGVTDNFFGRAADWDAFLGDACENEFTTLDAAARDLAAITAPVVFFNGEDDAWVELEDVATVIAKTRRGSLVPLPATKHEVQENAASWSHIFESVVSAVVREAWGLAEGPTTFRVPSQRCLLRQNRVERRKLRDALAPDGDETGFWTGYLGKYVVLEHVHDFGKYLDLVCDLLEPIGPGSVVLDAGCGTGLFGNWLLRRKRQLDGAAQPVTYIGVDLTTGGLTTAFHRHGTLQAEQLRGPESGGRRTVDLFFATADFDRLDEVGDRPAIPAFADGGFDAVCCSLVLSYLERPHLILHELKRLLRPGGRLVVSSMKPHCDVSNIYRDFVETRSTAQEVESARNLLGGVREIMVKQELGIYVFYTGEELARMVADAGFGEVQIYTSFGDQAVVVRALA